MPRKVDVKKLCYFLVIPYPKVGTVNCTSSLLTWAGVSIIDFNSKGYWKNSTSKLEEEEFEEMVVKTWTNSVQI